MDDDDFFPLFAQWARTFGLENAERRARGAVREDVLTRLVEKYRRMVEGIEISDPPVVHGARDPWYPGPIEGDRFWPSLEAYLDGVLGWDEDRIKPVDRSSTKVVANTPRPEKPAWTCKGLVVGYVQSGKTTNYTSVIAKAADNGYKLVIVLSGTCVRPRLARSTSTDWMRRPFGHRCGYCCPATCARRSPQRGGP